MNGYDAKTLAQIDVELKEAVCDALVNIIVRRVSGTDEAGQIVFGRSPRRSIVSGQLLPRFDVRGEDETSDIRIAALGLDFAADAASKAVLSLVPRYSVYVRVLPEWGDLKPANGPLDFDFRLKTDVHHEIEEAIRARRTAAFAAQGLERPDWRKMDETERSRVRDLRGRIQEEIRIQAYAERGIRLRPGDDLAEGETSPTDETLVDETTDESGPNQPETPPPTVTTLLRDNRDIPLGLLDPSPIPPKWKRLDLSFPPLEWAANLTGAELNATVGAYCQALWEHASQQLHAWLQGDGQAEAWRDLTVVPADAVSREAWDAFLARARSQQPDARRVLPDLSRVVVRVERQADFLDRRRASFRLSLDNQCQELGPREAQSICNTVFATGLVLSIPVGVHRPLQLDRVEPSYRFRHYLEYPAIGLNCGVSARESGETLELATTWSPRFVQPRITPTDIGVPCEFAELASPSFDLVRLLDLPKKYKTWVKQKSSELEVSVREGLDPEDADRETARLRQDVKGQLDEAEYIERGVQLLIEARRASEEFEHAQDEKRKAFLQNRSLPWRAWLLTNEAFARRDKGEKGRGWRLFQLAFILAHIPVFASRLDEYRDAYDAKLDEDTASLLYFPTGGGKSEAFYGALLFALFLDRLRGKDRGITALVRYPLRLLTLQQAQRLLKLVASAELIRKQHKIGSWPFEIGFWVGSANTPNSYSGIRADVPRFGDASFPDDRNLEEDATGTEEELERARRYRETRDAYDKVPDCPVCGHPTGFRRYEVLGPTARRAAIVCFNPGCDWNTQHGGIQPLPFLLTDDTIYERAPAVLVGTVDKLAMLGQHTNTVAKVLGMFGLARWIDPNGHLSCERRREKLEAGPQSEGMFPVFPSYHDGRRVFFDPFPALIIQDEAHLLEESLGTFSGLFDTLLENVLGQVARIAGDELGVRRKWTGDEWDGPRMPKIVAATATISNPERQLEMLYQRLPLRFPYPGPDIYHSFFAEPAAPPPANADRVRLAASLPSYLAPEATSPWMRLYVSLMTNGATHTVTTVQVLSAFHAIITDLWVSLRDPDRAATAVQRLRAAITQDRGGPWREAAIDRAIAADRVSDIMALVDLHRIGLAYVTNKKGGDQVIDALDAAVRQQHRQAGYELSLFDSRLISGGVDMKEIQRVMNDAGTSFAGKPYPSIDETVRNIVATAAISHGVDVDRFNSMFFAGLPSDIAEYIQASSRVGRTHVGFVMLLPTPQNRRDRYVVETHDIFHRFLERMIAPPAVERWAENAIRRILASFAQTWTMLREADEFVRLGDDNKANVVLGDMVRRLGARANQDIVGFCNDLGDFILSSAGYAGRGPIGLGRPNHDQHYRGLVDRAVQDFALDLGRQTSSATLREYWEGQTPVFQKPMTSLRDVDEAGLIVASGYDPRPAATERTTRVNRQDLATVMRAIRSQRGEGAETDDDGDAG